MDELAARLTALDGLSLLIGVVGGFLFAAVIYRFYGKNLRNTFERVSDEMKSSFKSLSSEALQDSQDSFLNLAKDKLDTQTQQHGSELESKKELIDQQLQQMSETLKTVPTELEKSQTKVTEVLDKSTDSLKESNQNYLNQLTEKTEMQTKEHSKELETKKELIDQRLTDMDVKLGKVEQLVQELQTDRKTQFSELGERLQTLATTTDYLQKALADNRARGKWGEDIAKSLLKHLGYMKGIDYEVQHTDERGGRPDFRFRLPNNLSLNMDVKFPLDNYEKFYNASSDTDKERYRKAFLSDVKGHVRDITGRNYINSKTVDCVLIFIPVEQIYSFIYEQDEEIIRSALQQKIIICSPLTLYSVLAVIHKASESFAFAERSREIFALLGEIKEEWQNHTEQMDKLEGNFKRVQNNFLRLRDNRVVDLDSKFERLSEVQKRTQLTEANEGDAPVQLPEETP